MTTTTPGFLLAMVLMFSCGGRDNVAVGTQKIGPEMGVVTLVSTESPTRASALAIRVTGTTASGAVAFSRVEQRRPELRWEAPTTVSRLIIESLANQSVQNVYSLPINIQAGQNVVLTDPDLQEEAAPLRSLTLQADGPRFPIDFTPRLRAQGTFADGSTADLSHSVTWSSLVPAVARIDAGGLLSPQAPGAVTVQADLLDRQARLELRISKERLSQLLVEPESMQMAAATSATLTAKGQFSDGSLLPIVDGVGWESSLEAIATVDSSGKLIGLNPGTTQITATHRGGKSAATTVTVSSANLQSLTVTPASGSAPIGDIVTFSATGHFSDNTRQDLTDFVTWGSSDSRLAVVDRYGKATATAAGRALIIANDPESPILASAALTVTATPDASPIATSLAFDDVSRVIPSGGILEVAVTVLDQFGHPVPAQGIVTLSLGKPPTTPQQTGEPSGESVGSWAHPTTAHRRSSLVGTLRKELLDGSTSFDDLKVQTSGAFVLRASMNGVQSATSNVFVVTAQP